MEDRSWMHANKLSCAYAFGVAEFLKFAKANAKNNKSIPCPCAICGNNDDFPPSVVNAHLFFNGILQTYTFWNRHGEGAHDNSSDNSDSTSSGSSESGSIDRVEVEYTGPSAYDHCHDDDDDVEFSSEDTDFRVLVEDANKPLYPGCERFTKLEVLVKLYNIKAKHGLSDSAYGDILVAFGVHLPEGNEIPTSVYEVKKTLGVLGMDYQKIHACPNDCLLYRKEYKDDVICDTCKTSRWKVGKNGNLIEGVPAKVLWYLDLIPRFKRMYQSATTAPNMTWHATGRLKDGLICHPADAKTWQAVDEKWPEFGQEPRNLRLALSSDGFNPFNSLSSTYSCWPVILVNYNLPLALCMKRKYMMLCMLISGPKQPGNDIDVYLEPLIEDLEKLWKGVTDVYDATSDTYFTLRAALFWTINDFPAYGNLSGNIVKGYNACPICLDKTKPIRLEKSQKFAYVRHRRHKKRHHPYRRQRAAFDGHQEFEPAPIPLSGEEVLKRIEEEVQPWKFGKKYPRPQYKGAEDEKRPCWKKKSIFFRLEYWKFLPVRHCLDVMHIEKNVCESLVGTLLNIPRKNKDGIKVRQDLVKMGIRPDLAPKLDGPSKDRLPLATWNLCLEEKKSVCGCLACMKLPRNYSSNISSLISMEHLKIGGMKSHDCHVLMQQLLPVSLRAVLDKPVRVAVIRLCLFFSEICSKTFEMSKLPKIQSNIVETLCLLEMYFPPSFFDIMVHLTVHLVREVEFCGPVFYRWMYPFERYMKVCKGYVRNRNHPEGCIAENYVTEEAIEWLAEKLVSDRTVGIPKQQSKECKPTSGAEISTVYGNQFNQAVLCVLQNTKELQPYFIEHMEELIDRFPKCKKIKKWLKEKQNKEFADWVKKRVSQQLEDGEHISETVRWISRGPCHEVSKFNSYQIDGVLFYTRSLDDRRKCQNSGVYLEAEAMLVASARDKNPVDDHLSFYGVIDEIWELDYTKFSKPIFKCDWAECSKGVKVDDLGFTLVNLNRLGYLNDSFVLGTSVYQVFYVKDPLDPMWSVVLRAPQSDYVVSGNDDEQYDILFHHHSLTDRMPYVESFEEDVNCIRAVDETIMLDD